MNFMKTDYELKRSKRKTLSLTVTKDLKVSVKAPVGCPQKTIDDFVLSHEKWINEHIENNLRSDKIRFVQREKFNMLFIQAYALSAGGR